jgi:hypothetical protein
VLVYATTALPFAIFQLRGAFEAIPRDLEEAAMVDGATRWQAFVKVVLPAARPAIAVTCLFAFMSAWNEFILAATFLSHEEAFTLPVALQRYVGEYDAAWGRFAAGADRRERARDGGLLRGAAPPRRRAHRGRRQGTPPLRFDAPGLVVTLPGGETSVAAYWYEKQQFGDFSVSVTVALLSAQEPTQSYCGHELPGPVDKDNYRLFIDGEGYYRLTRRVDNVSTALIDWTRHDALKAGVGEENRVQIVTEGAKIIRPRQRRAAHGGDRRHLRRGPHRAPGAGRQPGDRERDGVLLPRPRGRRARPEQGRRLKKAPEEKALPSSA